MNNCLVIIPTYNEKENIEDIIRAVFDLSQFFDVLVVDDNSPDGTGVIVNKLTERLNNERNSLHLISRDKKAGLGTAYIAGFKFALDQGYQFIFEMDADFSHNPEDLLKLLSACKDDGNDVAVGSRYITGVNVVNWPLNRVLLSLSASKYVKIVTGMPIDDPTAGFVCYKREVLEKFNLELIKFVGYAFQIEMKHLAWKAGFKIVEIPIIFTDRVKGKSKMSTSIFREAVVGVIEMKFSDFHKKLNE